MDPEVIQHVGNIMLAMTMASARLLGATYLLPVFTWPQFSGPVRAACVIGMTLPVTIFIHPQINALHSPIVDLAALVAKEFIIGWVLGFALGIPFWAAQAAGDMIDTYRGANAMSMSNPLLAADTTVLGQFMNIATLGLFISAGGFAAIMQIVFESYQIWPVMSLYPPAPSADLLPIFASAFTTLTKLALVLAAPVLIALAVMDLIMSFIARGWRGLNIQDIGEGLKNLMVLILMPIYTAFIASYVEGPWQRVYTQIKMAFGLNP